jgi:hypothetical protein
VIKREKFKVFQVRQKEYTTMTRKEYIKPTMRTVELKHRTKILIGSNEGVNDELQEEQVEKAW